MKSIFAFFSKLLAFTAGAHKAASGMPSSRRLAQSAAIATAIGSVAWAMWTKIDIPPNAADLLKFLVVSTGAGVVVGKFAETKSEKKDPQE